MNGAVADVPASLISEKNAALLVDDVNGTLEICDNTVSLTGNADDAANVIVGATDPNTARDGAESATEGDGLVYNASARNAFYRYGIGSAMAVWGKDSHVKLSSTDGRLVVDGEATGSAYPAGTMAGAVKCAVEHPAVETSSQPAAGAPAGEQGAPAEGGGAAEGAPADGAPATDDAPAGNAAPEAAPASDAPASK